MHNPPPPSRKYDSRLSHVNSREIDTKLQAHRLGFKSEKTHNYFLHHIFLFRISSLVQFVGKFLQQKRPMEYDHLGKSPNDNINENTLQAYFH